MSRFLSNLVACPDCHREMAKTADFYKCVGCNIPFDKKSSFYDFRPKNIIPTNIANTKVDLSFASRFKGALKSIGLFHVTKFIYKIIFFPLVLVEKLSIATANRAYRQIFSDIEIAKEHFNWLFLGEKLDPNELIFEISCATGKNILMLKKLGYQAVGMDLKYFNEHWLESPEDFFQANAYYLPLKNTSIQYILSIAALTSYKEDEKAIKEMSRVLKKEGLVFLLVAQHTLYNRLWKRSKYIDNYKEYKLKELVELFNRNGFDLVKSRQKGFYFPIFPYFINQLLGIGGGLFGGIRGIWGLMEFIERFVPNKERGQIYAVFQKR